MVAQELCTYRIKNIESFSRYMYSHFLIFRGTAVAHNYILQRESFDKELKGIYSTIVNFKRGHTVETLCTVLLESCCFFIYQEAKL